MRGRFEMGIGGSVEQSMAPEPAEAEASRLHAAPRSDAGWSAASRAMPEYAPAPHCPSLQTLPLAPGLRLQFDWHMLGSVDTASMAMAMAMLADGFGGWEIILILSVVLILFAAEQLPKIMRGLDRGAFEFKKRTEEVLEQKASGLVYEALTVENRTAEFVYPEKESPNVLREMTLLLAQGFGVGRIPFAPGTFGSLLGLVWVAALVATGNYWLYVAGTLAGLALSVPVCGAAEKILKQKDPPSVVLDEIVALPICFLVIVTQAWVSRGKVPPVEWFLTGPNLVWTVLIFVLFRLFDIVKPWPVGQSQRLPGGWGVTVDDLLAAVYVAIITLLAPK